MLWNIRLERWSKSKSGDVEFYRTCAVIGNTQRLLDK